MNENGNSTSRDFDASPHTLWVDSSSAQSPQCLLVILLGIMAVSLPLRKTSAKTARRHCSREQPQAEFRSMLPQRYTCSVHLRVRTSAGHVSATALLRHTNNHQALLLCTVNDQLHLLMIHVITQTRILRLTTPGGMVCSGSLHGRQARCWCHVLDPFRVDPGMRIVLLCHSLPCFIWGVDHNFRKALDCLNNLMPER